MEVQHKAPNFKKHFSQTALAKLIWYIFKFLEVKIIVIAIDLLLCKLQCCEVDITFMLLPEGKNTKLVIFSYYLIFHLGFSIV